MTYEQRRWFWKLPLKILTLPAIAAVWLIVAAVVLIFGGGGGIVKWIYTDDAEELYEVAEFFIDSYDFLVDVFSYPSTHVSY